MINPKAVLNKAINDIDKVLFNIKNCSFQHVYEFKVPSEALFDETKVEKILGELTKMKGRFIYIISNLGTRESSEIINETYLRFDITNKPRVSGKTFNISKFNNTTSKTLYVGTSKKLKSRVKQHFGYGNKRTYSLDLIHWFPKNIDLTLNIYKVSTENQLAIELIEQSIWDLKKPQFGKRSGL